MSISLYYVGVRNVQCITHISQFNHHQLICVGTYVLMPEFSFFPLGHGFTGKGEFFVYESLVYIYIFSTQNMSGALTGFEWEKYKITVP